MPNHTALVPIALLFALAASGCAPSGLPGPVESSGEEASASTDLDGTYSVTWTADELYERLGGADNPEARELAEGNQGELRLTFDAGEYELLYVADSSSCPGTYEIDADRVVLTATIDPAQWDCGDGVGQLVADARWTVDAAGLTLTDWNLSPEPAMDWVSKAMIGEVLLARSE
jgi:hypothetical protein